VTFVDGHTAAIDRAQTLLCNVSTAYRSASSREVVIAGETCPLMTNVASW
jgi:hypothetical protein